MVPGQSMHNVFQFGLCEYLPEMSGQRQRKFVATPTACVLLDPSRHKTGCRIGKSQQRRISGCVLTTTEVAMGSLLSSSCFFLPADFPRESQGCAMPCHAPEPWFSGANIRDHRSLWSPCPGVFPVQVNTQRFPYTSESPSDLGSWCGHGIHPAPRAQNFS